MNTQLLWQIRMNSSVSDNQFSDTYIWDLSKNVTVTAGPTSLAPASVMGSNTWVLPYTAATTKSDSTLPTILYASSVWQYTLKAFNVFTWNLPQTYQSYIVCGTNTSGFLLYPIVDGQLVMTPATLINTITNDDNAMISPDGQTIQVTVGSSYRRFGDQWLAIASGVGSGATSTAGAMCQSKTGSRVIIKDSSTTRIGQLNPNGRTYTMGSTTYAAASALAMTSDGAYTAIGRSSAGLLAYKWVTGTTPSLTALTVTNNYTGAAVKDLAFSPDGVYLAVTYASTVANQGLILYKRTGDTFAKVTLSTPAATYSVVAWSPDGALLVTGVTSSSPLNVYSRSGDTFTQEVSPTITTGQILSQLTWNSDGTILYVGMSANLVKMGRSANTLTVQDVYALPNSLSGNTVSLVVYPSGLYGI